MIRWHWLVFWFVLWLSSPLHAERICINDDPRLCSQPIRAGEKASFAGQLLTPQFAIRLGQKIERCELTFDLELEARMKMIKMDLEFERKLRTNDRKMFEGTISNLRSELAQPKISWYEHPVFVAVTTATLVTLIFVGAKYALIEE